VLPSAQTASDGQNRRGLRAKLGALHGSQSSTVAQSSCSTSDAVSIRNWFRVHSAGFGLIAVTLMVTAVAMPLVGHDVVFSAARAAWIEVN